MDFSAESNGIRVAVVLGSVRPGNYTKIAAALVVDELCRDPRVSVDLIDPAGFELPLPGVGDGHATPKMLRERIGEATAVVLATPEYHGGFSSVMKLVIENLGFPSALSGKPIALLGVAAGVIGAIKSLEQLRSVVSHVGGLALPLPISVARVQKVFDRDGRCLDEDVEKRVRAVAGNLLGYIDRNICPSVTLERLIREGGGARGEVVAI